MPLILDKILSQKRKQIEKLKEQISFQELEKLLADAEPVRDAYAYLLREVEAQIPVIAEIKRKSPSEGEILPELELEQWAEEYEKAGARAISVLTESDFFGGSLEDLQRVKRACVLPVLCKDFIFTSFQILCARIYGADLVLLIVRILEKEKLFELYKLAKELGMTPLVEVHNQKELEIALELEARWLGINNRDLDNLKVDLNTTRELLPLIPPDRIIISESGFSKREELEEFRAMGVQGFLIGTSILKSAQPFQKLRELVYGSEG